MQAAPVYGQCHGRGSLDYLRTRIDTSLAAGIDAHDIIIDPGFGFGKTLEHNLQLLRELDRLVETRLSRSSSGLSRKSMLGTMTNRDVDDRLAGSLALALLAAQNGAAIIRVHDVAPTVDVLRVLGCISDGNTGPLTPDVFTQGRTNGQDIILVRTGFVAGSAMSR